VLQFRGSHAFTIYETIQDRLVQRIAKFNDNIVHFLSESWVLNQLKAKLRVLSRPVPFSERYEIRAIKSCNHGLCGVLCSHLTPPITVQEAEHEQREASK